MKTAKEIMDILNSIDITDVDDEVDRITEEFAKEATSGKRSIDIVVKSKDNLAGQTYVKYVDQVRAGLHRLGFYTSCLKYNEWGPEYIIVSVDKLSWMKSNLRNW